MEYTIDKMIFELRRADRTEKRIILNELFEKYDSATIVGELAQKYSEEELLDCLPELEPLKAYKKKISTIGTFYFRFCNGGTERVLSLLIPLWVSLGYKVILFTDEEASEKDYHLCEGAERVVLSCPIDLEKKSYIIRAKELKEKLIENHVDIMVYHAWMSRLLFWDMVLVKSLKIPFLIYTHGVFSSIYCNEDSLMEKLPEIYRLSDGVISLTEVSQRFYEIYGANSFFLQNPVNLDLLKAEKSELNGKNILWIGRISGEKNPTDAIRIMKKVLYEEPESTLYVVGEGYESILREMQDLCVQYHIDDHVYFCGYQEKVEEYYLKADVMLMTSEFEGYSMTLLESKAYGVPCVMYELPYLSLVKDGLGICSVNQGDIKGAAKKIVELLRNEDERKRLGEEARKSFQGVVGYDIGEKWKEIFNEIEKGDFKESYSSIEKMIFQLVVEQKNLDCRKRMEAITQSREYQYGSSLLKLFRRIKHWKRINKEK